jgi:hypothetical protein
MKEPMKPSERRRVPRIAVNFPVKVTLGRKQYRCQATEFSEFGILLASKNNELAGDVEVELALNPPSTALSLMGVVAYTTDSGVAVRFKNISPEQQAVLRNYLEAQGKKTA